MGRDSSGDKEGLQSSGRKEQSSRHGVEPTPAMKPVPGAFGKDGEPVRIEEREEPVAEDPAAEEGPSEDAC